MLPHVHPRAARRHRQHRRRRGRAAAGRRAPRRRRPVSRRRGRQGHRHVLRRRQRARGRVRLLARRRVRVGWVVGLRPQGDGDHVAWRVDLGARALPARWASTPTPPTLTVVGIGDMSGDVFGNGMLRSPHIKLVGGVRPPARVPRSRSRPRGELPRARTPVRARPRPSWADYDPAVISAGGGVYPRDAKSCRSRRGAGACSRLDAEAPTPDDAHPGDPARARRPPLERRHRHVREGEHRVDADVGDRANDAVRVDADRAALHGGRRGRQPRAHPARRGSSTRSRAAG